MRYVWSDQNMAEAIAANQNIITRQPIGSTFTHGVSMIPHIDKREKGGEDAYISRNDLLVVADGVGGWAE